MAEVIAVAIPRGAILTPSSDTDLPDFVDPPVREVALGFQFQPLARLRVLKLGLLWAQYRARGFPHAEEHPPLANLAPELPPATSPSPMPTVQIEWSEIPPTPRCWFLNDSRTTLIQVQQNRFVQNWRHVGEGETYPRYKSLRRSFVDELAVFQEFVRQENIGEIAPDQCEVTYVNHLARGRGWEQFGEGSKIVGIAKAEYSDDFVKEPEDVRLTHRYVIVDDSQTFLGRLHVTLEPAFKVPDLEPMLMLTLSARGRPIGDGIDGVLTFCDIGHRCIVKAFASITTRKGHDLWQRRT